MADEAAGFRPGRVLDMGRQLARLAARLGKPAARAARERHEQDDPGAMPWAEAYMSALQVALNDGRHRHRR